mmetsp:Transcript_9199/g.28478  ORF Transcript_9199/g.28478 Transcript_9199/m.28478 type:complete len:435 (-) Transcript_9199:84-1388(-)|eukprot:CAMPEP_0177653614 /NCGR_PEP_ID=MMETSP0447-20121125/13840_1 /TAXON_ID=0 /ORGANISM="Stygamoeba regulata, Strain BSH-02190019" /LENGTH=434 /DNA_ID=CAMNT_0019157103 /DNA_START=35 /DNA_END=1339 /DNA_ORIENTATION=-
MAENQVEVAQLTVVVGAQWGDEGKGKLTDDLAREFDLTLRYNGGSNAGHTIVVEGRKYALHLIPCGILNPKAHCLLGNGVVVHIPTLFKELAELKEGGISYEGRMFVAERAHLVFDYHMTVDGMRETSLGKDMIGTTKKGIGPAYAEKMNRTGLRAVDLLRFDTVFKPRFTRAAQMAQTRFGIEIDIEAELQRYREFATQLTPMIVDGVDLVNSALESGKKCLLEGANGVMLDIDLGTYPYVTSSHPYSGGGVTGLGIAPQKFGAADVIAIVKAYTTRVGEGPFVTELTDDIGAMIQKDGHEFGTTTGRPRRCGWLDLVVMKYSHRINHYTKINITKLDVLSCLDEIKVAVAYKHNGKELPSFPSSLELLGEVEVVYQTFPGWKSDITGVRNYLDLPEAARNYVQFVEDFLKVPVRWVGVGPDREATIVKQSAL